MADKSKIEWTDATWTPIRARRLDTGKVGVHCERVSPACTNCYAATFNKRNLPSHGTGLDFIVPNREKVEIFIDEEMLMAPSRWKRPRKIFVCSQTDLFGEFVSDEQIAEVFLVMALCKDHVFQVLTKRPDRMHRWMTTPSDRCIFIKPKRKGADWIATDTLNRFGWPLPNVWLGVTAENQEWADKRIPLLLQTPAARRFVSVEPMLGAVDLRRYMWPVHAYWEAKYANYDECLAKGGSCGYSRQGLVSAYSVFLDQVICGGESGTGARPMQLKWARSLRDQCVNAGTAYFFKQFGAYAPIDNLVDPLYSRALRGEIPSVDGMYRVGKKAAGRLLDGVEWSQFPKVEGGQSAG